MEYDKNLKRSVGKRVHDFRVQHDYTQAQFAEFMDISVNFLSEIENGKKGNVTGNLVSPLPTVPYIFRLHSVWHHSGRCRQEA